MRIKNNKAQGILEYAVLLAIVAATIVGIQIYVKRAMEGRFKQSADQIGEQFTTNEAYTIQNINQSARAEKTLVDTTGTEWSKSTIQAADAGFVPDIAKITAYGGYELTKTDFVQQAVGTEAVGTHGTFDSSKISDVKLFDDD